MEPTPEPSRNWIAPILIAAVVIWAWFGLQIELGQIAGIWDSMRLFWSEFFPPDFSQRGLIWEALIETIQIAVLSTVFGVVLSVPLGMMAARNVFPTYVATPIRLFASAVRVLPSLLWALFAVIIVGPGPFAGVIAMTFYTIGYLAKLQSEAIEGIPRDALDAVRAMGAPRWQQAWHVVMPEAANALRSQALFMFEYNVRSSSVVGFVGAGGLGVLMDISRQFYAYDRILAYLIVLFIAVVATDAVSYLIRRRYIELEDAPRARWRDLLWPREPAGE